MLKISLIFESFDSKQGRMPKRDNPFGDGSPIQLKSHIGTKEIDLGIAHGAKMQEVYGKGLDPLEGILSEITDRYVTCAF